MSAFKVARVMTDQQRVYPTRKDYSPVSLLLSSLRRQMIGAFVAVCVVFAIALLVGYLSIGSVDAKVQSGARILPRLERATGHAKDMTSSEARAVLDPARIVDHEGDVQTFQHVIHSLDGYATSPAGRSAATALNSAFATWLGIDNQIMALARAHKTAAATQLTVGPANQAGDALTSAVGNVSKAISDNNTAQANSAAASSKTLMLVIALIALLIAAAISFLLSRDFAARIKRVLDGINRLQEHDLDALGTGLDALSRGDLTVTAAARSEQIDSSRADELGQLTETFNAMVDKAHRSIAAYNESRSKVATMLREISGASEQLALSSQQMASVSEEAGRAVGEIAQAVSSVAAGAEDQVRSIAEAKILTDEVSVASQSSADGAQQTAEAAAHARSLAEEGAQAVSQATDAMHAVRDSSAQASNAIRALDAKSEQIGEIVDTITGIAEQTNLLALNAAIEAWPRRFASWPRSRSPRRPRSPT
jgi:methyl-accepting chemotaxis protein